MKKRIYIEPQTEQLLLPKVMDGEPIKGSGPQLGRDNRGVVEEEKGAESSANWE